MSHLARLLLISACAFPLLFAGTAFGQADHSLTWAQDIVLLQQIAPAQAAAHQATILQIRANIENWIKAHPESKLQLAAAPAQPITADKAAAEIAELNHVLNGIIAQDPTHPFHLGIVNVNVNAKVSPLSPMTDTIDQTEIAKLDETNAAKAMVDLPGVSLEQQYSGRNQVMVSIHGFDYLQVPLYVDGMLMNDPYDGTLDYRQIPSSNIAEIQVAKGFSSALMGPNAVGGAINIVTMTPQKRYQGEMMTGGYSGGGLISSIRLGSRMRHFFVEGWLDWTQANFIPLSGNFVTNAAQPNDDMNSSYSQDAKYAGRIGWTPNGRDEYVFTYVNMKANDGIPLNTGNDPLNANDCSASTLTSSTLYKCYTNINGKFAFRSWSYWDKTSYYFHSNTGVGDKSSIKLRVFYDEYPNLMYFYNVPSSITAIPVYTPSMLNLSSTTLYDDHSDGFATEFDTRRIRGNTIGASFYFKDDTHREVPLALSTGELPYGLDRQQVVSIGLQDLVTLTERLNATAGMSFDHLDGLQASNSGNNYYAFTSPQCPSNTDETNFTACTPHQWAYNPQVSATYTFKDFGRLFVGFAQKSRFPVLKEMYSFKMAQGIPNPNLLPEHSQNYDIGYSRPFGGNTVAQVEYFYSKLNDAIESIPAPQSLINEYPTGICPNPNVCTINENASHETHQGAEFTLHTTPVSRLTVEANYTYTNKEIAGFNFEGQAVSGGPCGSGDFLAVGTGNPTLTNIPDNTCLTPTDLPRNKAVTIATLRLPYNAMLTSSLRYEGGNKAVDRSFKATPPGGTTSNYYIEAFPMSNFATWELAGTIPFYKGSTIQAGVKNLLDRNYFEVLQFPEEGRNWFVNMRYNF